ncbi:MAG: hypothetical protein U0166_27590 [Acidobacteriota bacterium]
MQPPPAKSLIDPAAAPPCDWADRGFYVVVEFEQSSSKNFGDVLSVARACPGYVELILEGGLVVHRNLFRKEDLGRFPELFSKVAGWRSTRFFINGDPVTHEIVQETVMCYVERGGPAAEAKVLCGQSRVRGWPLPEFLGCHRYKVLLNRNPFYRDGDQAWDWYEYGRVVGPPGARQLQIDKEQMKRHLSKGSYCPNFRKAWLAESIDRLPEAVPLDPPARDIEWKLVGGADGAAPPHVARRGSGVFPAKSTEYKSYLRELCRRGQWTTAPQDGDSGDEE